MATLRNKVDTLEEKKETLEENLLQVELKLEEEIKKCENYKQRWSRADAQRMSLKTLHDAQVREQKKQNGSKSSEKNELLQLREEKKSNTEVISGLEDHVLELQEKIKTLENEKKAYLKKQKRR